MTKTKSPGAPLKAAPLAFTPMLRIPQPNGDVLLRPGKPVVLEDVISTTEAARILGLSVRYVARQCEEGLFKTARKPGGQPLSQWRIARHEVMERREAMVD